MILETRASKTFEEYLAEHTDLYNNVSGYVFNTDSNEWEDTGITTITQDIISEWFGLRTVCSDEHFDRFFKRVLNNTALRYAQLCRIELSAFDPLVSNYVERQIIGNTSRVLSGSKQGFNSGSSQTTETGQGSKNVTRTPDLLYKEDSLRTPNLTQTESGTRTPNLTETTNNSRTPNLTESINGSKIGTSSEGNSGRDTVTRSNTNSNNTTTSEATNGETISKEAHKQAPQSISYQNGSGGHGAGGYNKLPGLDWQYMTSQSQNDTASNGNTTTTQNGGSTDNGSDITNYGRNVTGNTTDTNSETKHSTGNELENGQRKQTGTETHSNSTIERGSESNDTTRRHTGTETTATVDSKSASVNGTTSGSNNETTSGSESGLNESKEIMTGRNGLTPQEAFSQAVAYLKTSNAWDWLRQQLEPCFLSVYEV